MLRLILTTAKLGLLWILASNNALAASCMEKAKTDEEINVCQHALAKELEFKLKDLEEMVLQRFKGVQRERFLTGQASWKLMVQNDCELEADFFEGATVYPAVISRCRYKHYKRRINQIRNYLCPDHSLNHSCEQAAPFEITGNLTDE